MNIDELKKYLDEDREYLSLKQTKIKRLSPEICELTDLKRIDASETKIKRLPSEIGKLVNLEEIDISNTKIRSLPIEICMLKKLRKINLDNTNISTFPIELLDLKNLEEIYISNTKIKEIPSELRNLKKLRLLSLENTNIRKFPNEILECKSLEKLSLAYTKIKEIPNEIKELKLVDVLYLNNTRICNIPKEICYLSELTTLFLNNTKIKELPIEISQLKKLRELNLNNTEIDILLPEIGNLTSLEKLNLNNTGIESLPKEIGFLKKLRYLDLNETKIKKLPEEFFNLESLEKLLLSNTKLEVLSSNIVKLTRLKVLFLRNTKIAFLPTKFGELKKLSKLDLGYTGLKIFPKEVCELDGLRELYIDNVKIYSLPEEIGKLKNLFVLDLSNTKLKELPKEICSLKKLGILDLSNNKIRNLPNDLIKLKNTIRLSLINNPIYKNPLWEEINDNIIIKSIKIKMHDKLKRFIRKIKDYYINLYGKKKGIYKLHQTFAVSVFIAIIFVIIDLLDITQSIANNYIISFVPILAVLIITLLFVIIKKRKQLFNSCSSFDNIMHMVLFSSCILLVTYVLEGEHSILNEYTTKVINVLELSLSFSLICIIIHIICLKYNKKIKVYELGDLLNDNIKDNEFIISGNAANTDALKKNDLVSSIIKDIVTTRFDGHYNIGIEGKWGSGKTTLINLIKSEIKNNFGKNFVIIDGFNPWNYDSPETMVNGLLNCVIEEIGITKNLSIENSIKYYSSLLFGNGQTSAISEIINKINIEKSLFNEVNHYLEYNNKKLLIIFDDIDRCIDDNVFIIYKLVSTMLPFENTINILLYDYDQIMKLFEPRKIDPKYFEKIINRRYFAFSKDNELKEVFKKCIERIFTLKNIDIEHNDLWNALTNFKFNSIREIISFINFVDFNYCKQVNPNAFICLELIRYLNSNVYNDIANSKNILQLIKDKTVLEKRYATDLLAMESINKSETRIKNLIEVIFSHREYYDKDICFFDLFDSYFDKNIENEFYSKLKVIRDLLREYLWNNNKIGGVPNYLVAFKTIIDNDNSIMNNEFLIKFLNYLIINEKTKYYLWFPYFVDYLINEVESKSDVINKIIIIFTIKNQDICLHLDNNENFKQSLNELKNMKEKLLMYNIDIDFFKFSE